MDHPETDRMMKAILILAAAPWLTLSPLAAGELAPLPIVAMQVGCEIRASKSDAGTRLDAVISASGPVSGRYAFRVEPQSGGEPLISEEADFSIDSPSPSEVKKAGIDLPPGEGYSASLSIEWPNGSSSCSAAAS